MHPPRFEFRAELWLHTGEAAWHFVTLPTEVADDIDEIDEIDERAATGARGFGSVPVRVTVGATTWDTSIFPDTKAGSFLLPVKKGVRSKEGLEEGAMVDICLELRTLGRPI